MTLQYYPLSQCLDFHCLSYTDCIFLKFTSGLIFRTCIRPWQASLMEFPIRKNSNFIEITHRNGCSPGKKGVLKICGKFTGEHPCRYAISIKLLCYFNEITLWHRCSPVNLLQTFITLFPKNSFGQLLPCIIDASVSKYLLQFPISRNWTDFFQAASSYTAVNTVAIFSVLSYFLLAIF